MLISLSIFDTVDTFGASSSVNHGLKILAIIAGVFFAVLIYLEQQGMVNINWDKTNTSYHGSLSTVTNAITNNTSGGTGGSHTTAISLLPTLTNLGIPLTGNTAVGFVIGIMKG